MIDPTRPSASESSTHGRLQKFMLAAPVVAAGVAAGSQAQASVVVFDVNPDVSVTTASGVQSFGNLNPTTGYDRTATSPVLQFNFQFSKPEKPWLNANGGVAAAVTGNYISAISPGTTIDNSLTFSAGIRYFETNNVGPWNAISGLSTQYVAIRLANGPDFNYGWVDLGYDDAANTMAIKRIAFETTLNQAITAGATAIPEPASTVLLFAAGAAGVVAYRRRKAAAALAA